MTLFLSIEIILFFIAFAKDKGMDDLSISISIRNGDKNAFKEFYDRHYDSLYRFLMSRGLSHDETKDLVQRAFLMIWEKRSEIDDTKSLRSFLFTIAYTRMLNHIEYQSKFSDVNPSGQHKNPELPDGDLDHRELVGIIKKIISQMPEKRGLVFDLCFMKQFTYKETADALGVSTKTVENHMALAFKDMRRELKEVYGYINHESD
ncbi:MAG: RNA polymerase sigma factor [Balneolaceae bacterium]